MERLVPFVSLSICEDAGAMLLPVRPVALKAFTTRYLEDAVAMFSIVLKIAFVTCAILKS